eukprot:SAG11_NODE_3807_length_2212_cov_116.090393_4_plen_90_part_00
MSKALSKMNKRELYEECQKLQSELHTATLFNASLEEETKTLIEELENKCWDMSLELKTLRKRLNNTREKLKNEKESVELILEGPDAFVE